MQVLWLSLVVMGVLGFVAMLLLSVAAVVFAVEENPLVDQVEELLPGANCGGCGFAGCRNFAEALVKTKDPSLYCPVGGAEVMAKIGALLGIEMGGGEPKVARLVCSGSPDVAKRVSKYISVKDCEAAALIFSGEKECAYGCLGLGSCAEACPFNAITMENGLPRIDENKCVGCGVCVDVCPKNVLVLMPRSQKTYVACSSRDSGAQTLKSCKVGCIGCRKCEKVCPTGAIKVENNLASIDPEKCENCGKCVEVCPTHAIHALYPVEIKTS